jgi:hypothetical protein
VQDATVPDHTRDDPHPIIKTYETYAKVKDSVPPSDPTYLDSLDAYFDSAANFSNSNFFSDDTILKYYPNPKISKEIKEIGFDGNIRNYGYNSFNKKVALVTSKIGDSGVIQKVYNIYDKNDNKVMADYWNTLAPKAVGYSAGVIKLFLSEVEKEKTTGILKKERMPWWEKLLELVKIKTDQLLASVNLSIKEKEQMTPLPPLLEPEEKEDPNLPAPEIEKEKTVQEQLIEIREKLERLKAELDGLNGAGELVILPAVYSANRVFSSLGTSTVNLEAPTTTTASSSIVIAPPIIISPADFSVIFSTSSITFSGTASSGLVVFNNFDRGQATTSEIGEWTMTINEIPQGSSTIKFFARDNEDNVSLPMEVTLGVDYLPLAINLSIDNCAQSLSSYFCLLKPTSTLNFIWSLTKPGDYKYDLIKTENDYGDWQSPETVASGVSVSETSARLNFEARDLLREFKWQVLAMDASSSEVFASSSEVVTTFHPRPIVINEIGWAGTIASNLDEWFELQSFLFEPSLNLEDYYVSDTNGNWRFDLSGDISPRGYYLVERGSDDVISNRSAQLVDNFIDDSSTKAFDLSKIGLKLWRKTDLGDILIDETPLWDKTGSALSSLERTWEDRVSTDISTWEVNEGCNETDGPCAVDRNATTTFGTPGVINMASIPRLW